jgi:hypothetical protein
LAPLSVAWIGQTTYKGGNTQLGGGSDGAGGIPYSGTRDLHGWFSELPTEGLIVNGLGQPVAGTQVIVTDSQGGVIAATVTDGEGTFCVELPVEPGLELTLPDEGVAGVPVEAGKPILIIVR